MLTILRIWKQRSDGICVITSVYLEGQSHLLHKLSIFSVLIISFHMNNRNPDWLHTSQISLIWVNMYILDDISFFEQYFLVHICLSGIFWFDNLKNVWFKGISLVLQMYFSQSTSVSQLTCSGTSCFRSAKVYSMLWLYSLWLWSVSITCFMSPITTLSRYIRIECTYCCVVCLVSQSCPTLCDPMDCSPPGSSVHGDSRGKNPGVGCHALLQGIFPTQGLNSGRLHCRQILCHKSHLEALKQIH